MNHFAKNYLLLKQVNWQRRINFESIIKMKLLYLQKVCWPENSGKIFASLFRY